MFKYLEASVIRRNEFAEEIKKCYRFWRFWVIFSNLPVSMFILRLDVYPILIAETFASLWTGLPNAPERSR